MLKEKQEAEELERMVEEEVRKLEKIDEEREK